MKNSVRVKCPAKINLTLEIVNRREDGFHNIKSIMQMISLYDFLIIEIKQSCQNKILLTGTSDEIPYDKQNLVYRAVDLYLKRANINNLLVNIHIEKNIPVSAGLAGGSTDAAGALLGMNSLLKVFDEDELNSLCSQLGSDLNVCLNGGTILATSRGEVTNRLKNIQSNLTLIKPKKLGISAKEAYSKYAQKEVKLQKNMTEKMIEAINNNQKFDKYLYNDLEHAVFEDYSELQLIKQKYPESIMSGSGPTFFVLENIGNEEVLKEYLFINGLKFIPNGVSICD